MHLCVQSSIVYNSQDTAATLKSVSEWMDKEDVVCVYTHNGICVHHKQWNNAICSNTDAT